MNYLVYPTKVMNVTQNHLEGNHLNHSMGRPWDYPFDEACEGTDRSWFYCPCDEMKVVRIYGVGGGGVNTVWLESTAKVDMPAGRGIVTVMVEHVEDEDLRILKIGQAFARGEKIFREGKDGATGNHFHISVATGKIAGTGWVSNGKAYVIDTGDSGTPLRADHAFYIDDVRIRNAAGYQFKEIPKEGSDMDNTPDNYAEKAVEWAKENGVLRGDDRGNLKLHEPITRQDMVVMLYRAKSAY
jgi:hypothetical protein